jgi:hypothetical protein
VADNLADWASLQGDFAIVKLIGVVQGAASTVAAAQNNRAARPHLVDQEASAEFCSPTFLGRHPIQHFGTRSSRCRDLANGTCNGCALVPVADPDWIVATAGEKLDCERKAAGGGG